MDEHGLKAQSAFGLGFSVNWEDPDHPTVQIGGDEKIMIADLAVKQPENLEFVREIFEQAAQYLESFSAAQPLGPGILHTLRYVQDQL